MSYVKPDSVTSPKTAVRNLEVVFDAGEHEGSWSVATFDWKGRPSVGIRWNGDPGDSSIGSPQARGVPTWFVVPEELEDAVLSNARHLAKGTSERLQRGYEAMAADTERETEALEWSEALLKDSTRA